METMPSTTTPEAFLAVGRRLQTMGWEGLTKGIGNKLTSRGGKVRGFSEFSTHPDQ